MSDYGEYFDSRPLAERIDIITEALADVVSGGEVVRQVFSRADFAREIRFSDILYDFTEPVKMETIRRMRREKP